MLVSGISPLNIETFSNRWLRHLSPAPRVTLASAAADKGMSILGRLHCTWSALTGVVVPIRLGLDGGRRQTLRLESRESRGWSLRKCRRWKWRTEHGVVLSASGCIGYEDSTTVVTDGDQSPACPHGVLRIHYLSSLGHH